MVNREEVYVTDLYKKHSGKEYYKGFYTVGKRIYQDDEELVTDSIALDTETLEILRAKIMAILIDELPQKKFKSKSIIVTKAKAGRNLFKRTTQSTSPRINV